MKKIKLIPALAALCVGISLATPAEAATFSCSSRVTFLGEGSGGTVTVATDFGTFSLCNISTATQEVAADTCKGWLSLLVTARGLGKPVTFYFDTAHSSNADVVSPYCTDTNFGWQTRIPYYLEVNFNAS